VPDGLWSGVGRDARDDIRARSRCTVTQAERNPVSATASGKKGDNREKGTGMVGHGIARSKGWATLSGANQREDYGLLGREGRISEGPVFRCLGFVANGPTTSTTIAHSSASAYGLYVPRYPLSPTNQACPLAMPQTSRTVPVVVGRLCPTIRNCRHDAIEIPQPRRLRLLLGSQLLGKARGAIVEVDSRPTLVEAPSSSQGGPTGCYAPAPDERQGEV
jgi:hypothetical protein